MCMESLLEMWNEMLFFIIIYSDTNEIAKRFHYSFCQISHLIPITRCLKMNSDHLGNIKWDVEESISG